MPASASPESSPESAVLPIGELLIESAIHDQGALDSVASMVAVGTASFFLALDMPLDQISPSQIEALKRFTTESVRGVLVTAIRIDLYSGSTIVRITIETASAELDKVAKEQIFERFGNKAALSKAVGIPVEHVSWDVPSWSDWYNMDTPASGTGDEELFAAVRLMNPALCDGREPAGVYCKTVANVSWEQTGETLACSLAAGGLRCVNSDNAQGCSDYKIRLVCPTAAPSSSPTSEPTAVPTWDSGGRPCSGHGQCVGTGGCTCKCMSGWYGTECGKYFIRSTAVWGVASECEGSPFSLSSVSPFLPGTETAYCTKERLRFNGSAYLRVALSEIPTDVVSCQASSTAPPQGTAAADVLYFTPTQPEPKELRVLGAVDIKDDGNATFGVRVVCTAKDSLWGVAESMATATTDDVPFPHLLSLFPTAALYIGSQVTLQGTHFSKYDEFEVYVGGIRMNGDGVFRTVLLNETAGLIVSVTFAENTDAAAWVRNVSQKLPYQLPTALSYSAAPAASYPALNSSITRRAKGRGSSSKAGVSAAALLSRAGEMENTTITEEEYLIDLDWYEQLLAFNDAQNVSDKATGSAGNLSDVYLAALNLTHASVEEASAAWPLFIEPAVTFDGRVREGILLQRVVLGGSLAIIDNRTYTIFREFVQPHNFSISGETISFLTPTVSAAAARAVTDANGYATITIKTSAGPVVNLTSALILVEACADIGWVGDADTCRRCPVGGYCPGGGRIWPLPGYFSFGEFSGFVTRCQPPLERCIGSQYSLCGDGYIGDYCSQCDDNYFVQGNFCLPCVEGEQAVLFAVLAAFLVVLNLLFFFAPYDVAASFLDMVAHLKMFRAIGMMASESLPPLLRDFYAKLGLFTLDFEFSKPGCGSTESDFLSIVWMNAVVLFFSILPVLFGMPAIMVFSRAVRRKIVDPQNAWERWRQWEEASRRITYWWTRFVSALSMWSVFATFIITSLSLHMIICLPVEGEGGAFVLQADRTVRCGESLKLWLLHLGGAAVFFGLALALPVLIVLKVKSFHDDDGEEGLERYDRLQKYGIFYESAPALPAWVLGGNMQRCQCATG